jgi:hypothetical protein
MVEGKNEQLLELINRNVDDIKDGGNCDKTQLRQNYSRAFTTAPVELYINDSR